jgi:hypothetical protein
MSERSVPVSIDLMEFENGCWKMDGSVSGEIPLSRFVVKQNGKEIPFRIVPRCARIMIEKEVLEGRSGFALELPISGLKEQNILEFSVRDEAGRESALQVAAVSCPAKVYSGLNHSYWCFDRYMVTMKKKTSGSFLAEALTIKRAGRGRRIRQELKLQKEILCAPYGSKQMFVMRALYWLVYPVYRRKNIWITFDKLYKGGDCGEYFYKYLTAHADDSIEPVYVIRADAPDRKRLEQEGFHPALYRSRKQRLSYLYARMVFGTHSGVNSFCGFNNWEVRFVQDRLRAINTCIQHGLSVQNL